MDISFLAAAALTLLLVYLGFHSPSIVSLLCFVLVFFLLPLCFALAPFLFKVSIMVAGLVWAQRLCWRNRCDSL